MEYLLILLLIMGSVTAKNDNSSSAMLSSTPYSSASFQPSPPTATISLSKSKSSVALSSPAPSVALSSLPPSVARSSPVPSLALSSLPPSVAQSSHVVPSHYSSADTSHIVPSKHVATSSFPASMSSKIPTQPPITTTPEPLNEFKFKLTVDNVTCLYLDGQANIFLEHNTTEKHNFSLPSKGGVASGHCFSKNNTDSEDTAQISLKWAKEKITLTCNFSKKDSMWFLSRLNVELPAYKASGSSDYHLNSNNDLFQAGENSSYVCAQDSRLKLNNTIGYNITVDFISLQVQPFNSPDAPFAHATMCPGKTDPSTTSSIVPIAVGCALAGLIVIVLIAYLIGRRKNSRGYQQV